MHINLWPGPEAQAWSAEYLCLLPTDWPVGTLPAQKQMPQCMSMCVYKCMWLHRSSAANSRPSTVAYQCAVRVLSHPRVGGSQSTLWPWTEQCVSTLELCFQRSGQPSLHTDTHISVHLYTVYALWCVYSEAKIALREKQAIVSFLMSGWWDFELGSDSHHFVHQRPIRHTGRRLPQWAGRGAVFKSDCRILIIAIGNICSLSYFHYCNDFLLLIHLTAHPVILWGLQKFSEMQVHQILNFSDIKDPAYLN